MLQYKIIVANAKESEPRFLIYRHDIFPLPGLSQIRNYCCRHARMLLSCIQKTKTFGPPTTALGRDAHVPPPSQVAFGTERTFEALVPKQKIWPHHSQKRIIGEENLTAFAPSSYEAELHDRFHPRSNLGRRGKEPGFSPRQSSVNRLILFATRIDIEPPTKR